MIKRKRQDSNDTEQELQEKQRRLEEYLTGLRQIDLVPVTNKELIEYLQKFPPDAIVVYSACSDVWLMGLDEIVLRKAEDKEAFLHHGHVILGKNYEFANKENLDFKTLVHFPGN